MPFDQFGQWKPRCLPKTKPFLYSEPAIICQAINTRKQEPCANRIYGIHYNQCQECGTFACLWHSGYRHKGYTVCDACYISFSELPRSTVLPISCKFCGELFTSYLELQKHYQPQEIGRDKLHRLYKINHGKLLNQYDYNGPWLYKVPEYDELNKVNLDKIMIEKNIHDAKAINPGLPAGKYQLGWVVSLPLVKFRDEVLINNVCGDRNFTGRYHAFI